jgi:hypothetical protein
MPAARAAGIGERLRSKPDGETTMLRKWENRYIEMNSIKVSDKHSDAVAYLYTSKRNGKPGAQVFFGKQSKPVEWGTYGNEAFREKRLKEMFASRQAHLASIKKYQDERNAYVNDYAVGDVLYTSWGYDQTNVEFFEVVAVKGKMVTVRQIGATYEQTGSMSGSVIPCPGQFVMSHSVFAGQELVRRARKDSIKIDDVRSAYRLEFTEAVPGVRVYKSKYTSSDH